MLSEIPELATGFTSESDDNSIHPFQTKLFWYWCIIIHNYVKEEVRCDRMQDIDLSCKSEAPGNMMRSPGFSIIHKADNP